MFMWVKSWHNFWPLFRCSWWRSATNVLQHRHQLCDLLTQIHTWLHTVFVGWAQGIKTVNPISLKKNIKYTLPWNCRALCNQSHNQTHAPETGTENPYQKTCTGFLQCVMRIGIDFFRYRNLVRSRTVFYSVQETVTKMTSTDWSDDRQLCCLFI